MKGEGMDKVREALAELVAATDPRGDTPVEGWKSAWRKAREALSSQPTEPVAYGYPNSAITGRNRWMMLRESIPEDDQYGGAMWVPLFAAPQPAPSEPAVPEGCACRWDADDKRVQTCERHQGWLDVIAEWADRARAAEAALAAARHPAAKGGEQ